MKFSQRTLLLSSTIAIAMLLGGGYWYVFVAGAPQLDVPVAEQDTGLTFQVETFDSPAMGEARSYGVVLPPGYARHPQKRYPVIVLLHGGHGSARDYEDKAKLTSILHDLYRTRKLPPAIVITPDGSDKRGSSPLWDPDYYNGPNGNVETLIASDLVQVVKTRYRTLDEPRFWAIGGLSSGAWGAFNIGLRHLDQFHTVFSHTGYFVDDSGAENSPQQFIHQIPPEQLRSLRAYLDAGEADHKYLQATQDFHQTLDQLGVVNTFRIFPGGHGIVGQDSGWNYWHKHLADSLAFVGEQFQAASPPPSHPAKKSRSHPVKPVVPHSSKQP